MKHVVTHEKSDLHCSLVNLLLDPLQHNVIKCHLSVDSDINLVLYVHFFSLTAC